MSTGPKPDVIAGLAKAKEASSMDRTLLRMRNQSGSNNFTHNFDLTYSVSFVVGHGIAFSVAQVSMAIECDVNILFLERYFLLDF